MDDFAIDEINVLNVDEVDDLLINEAGEQSFEPSKGMEFSSQKAAYDFYNTYAYIAGFSIRLRNCYKNRKGITTSIRLVCSKEGSTILQQHQLVEGLATDGGSIQKTPEKKTSSKRSSCQALCQVRLHKDEIWRVTSLQKDHNHELLKNTPSKKRHLRSHKRISMEEKADIQLLNEQNVGATQIREFLAGKARGKVNLHFSKKDVNNQIANAKRNLVGVDVNAMIDFFKRRQQEDQDFFFVIEPDEDNVAKNIFWVDGRSRRAYQEFGEVVIFDTTYNTNRYRMPMGPFIGVNHHRQSIFFGCALIRDEKKTTFFWLFQTWLEAMGGKKPLVIFTDQDLAMRAAIKKVFGVDTTHRCCLWHVMKNATDHLGKLYGLIEGFKDELADVIKLSLTVSDFETNWHYVLKKYKMENNSHLKQMFDKRDEWVPAYFRDAFCAGMSTTQRSESINAVTKIWMGSNTSLYDFATRFEKMVEGVYERESDEDIRTMNDTPQLWACHPIEVQARQVYTRNIFSLFKDKLKRCTALSVCEIEKERLYKVSPITIKYKYEWYKPNHMVLIDQTNGRADCECKGFQFQGVLCSHALEVMRFVKMQPFLPAHYILKRWTRDANASIKRGTNENNLKGKSDLQSVMRTTLTQRVERIVEAVKSRASYDMACTKLDELEEGIAKIEQGNEQAPYTTHNAMVAKNSNEFLQFQDPPISHCKGKRKPQRLKSPVEVKKGMRMCSYCHRKEGHNMSTCPKRFKAESSLKVQAQAFGAHGLEDNNEYNNERESEYDNMSTCPMRMLAESSFEQAFGVHDLEDNNECNNERESENDNLY